MQVTKITINYQANYNGCTVIVNDEFDSFDIRADKELTAKVERLECEVVDEAYKDVIKEGRMEGEFNGDFDDLEEFAVKRANHIFGEGIEIEFEVDESST